MINIKPIQADIIFKALHYVAINEGVEVSEELEEVFLVLAEQNPNDTDSYNVVEVMEYLKDFIINSDPYNDYFQEEEE